MCADNFISMLKCTNNICPISCRIAISKDVDDLFYTQIHYESDLNNYTDMLNNGNYCVHVREILEKRIKIIQNSMNTDDVKPHSDAFIRIAGELEYHEFNAIASTIDYIEEFYESYRNANDLEIYNNYLKGVPTTCENLIRIINKRIKYITNTMRMSEAPVMTPATVINIVPITDSETLPGTMISTSKGLKTLDDFLRNMHEYSVIEIMNLVNRNKDTFDSIYAKFIISLHTGKKYEGVPAPWHGNIIYGMLFNVNKTVLEYNLNDSTDMIISKYLPIYGTDAYNRKDLLIDIIKMCRRTKSFKRIGAYAKSHFSYMELLQMKETIDTELIDLIEESKRVNTP
jgi:hypothetical protein